MGAHTWLRGGAGGLQGAELGPRAFISLLWDNSSGAQLAPENHAAVRWPSGERAPPQGEEGTRTSNNLQEQPGVEPVPTLGSRLWVEQAAV